MPEDPSAEVILQASDTICVQFLDEITESQEELLMQVKEDESLKSLREHKVLDIYDCLRAFTQRYSNLIV